MKATGGALGEIYRSARGGAVTWGRDQGRDLAEFHGCARHVSLSECVGERQREGKTERGGNYLFSR